jgi:hypothetical protein
MKPLSEQFGQFWAKEKSLTILLLILIIHIFVIIPIGQKTMLTETIFLIFYASLLSAGLFLLIKNTTLRVLCIILLIILILLGSDFFFRSVVLGSIDDFIIVLYCVLLGWAVLLRTFSKGPVTVHRVQGGIVVYLLISLVFALLYQSVYQLQGEASFKGLGVADRKEFMYFSLVTLTTVGYGDITPAVVIARSLSNFESLIGQLYPAILIAGIVTKVMESKNK